MMVSYVGSQVTISAAQNISSLSYSSLWHIYQINQELQIFGKRIGPV